MLVYPNGLSPCQGPRRLAFRIVFRQLKFCIQWRCHFERTNSPLTTKLYYGENIDSHVNLGLVLGIMECTHSQASSPLCLQVHCYQNQRLTVEKVWKNGYPFDLSQVCHLVDIPITSKIKRVCLNIILMLALGTKGQTADHDPLTVINSASDLVTFPVYSAINLPLACHHGRFLLLRRF